MGKWAGWYRLHAIFLRFSLFFFNFYLFLTVLSLVAVRDFSSCGERSPLRLQSMGCLFRWFVWSGSTDCRCKGFGSCGGRLRTRGSAALEPWPGRSAACEPFPDQALTRSLRRGRAVLHHCATRESASQFSFVSLKLDHLSYLQNTCLKPTEGIQIPNILHSLFHTGVWLCNTFNLKFKGNCTVWH